MNEAGGGLNIGSRTEVVELTAAELEGAARGLFDRQFRLALVAAHDEDSVIRVVYVFTGGPPDARCELHIRLDSSNPVLPSLSSLSFPASRFEREMQDLFGIVLAGHPQPRRLVLHQHWPSGWHPMRKNAGPQPALEGEVGTYPFAAVEGDGIFEIPVGPVHAGLIEPGHFRFWVVGETILRMKARLWFVHKGIEKLFESSSVADGLILSERISGDSAVAHGLAYSMAVEDALGVDVSKGEKLLRSFLLELERTYNHVADIGALCSDVGLTLVNSRALELRERLLRINARVTGHRLLRGAIGPGTTKVIGLPGESEIAEVGDRFTELVAMALSNSTLNERFTGTALLSPADAMEMGIVGVIARASGQGFDARNSNPLIENCGFEPVVLGAGDVMARFQVRVREVHASLGLISLYLRNVGSQVADRPATDGPLNLVKMPQPGSSRASGLGICEGARGVVVHRVEIDGTGRITRNKIVDPSFLNWPALPVSLADTIVPDFPLANKSFSLSYAGNDL